MKRISRTERQTERKLETVLTVSVLAGLVLTGCGVTPHELLGVETLFEEETAESLVMETEETVEESAPDGTTEALPQPHDVKPGQILPSESLYRADIDQFFWQSGITDSVSARIAGKSYKEGAEIPESDLRYLQVLHYDFDGNVRVGELICNKAIGSDLLYIFHRLYEEKYPIERMVLVDEYDADDAASCSANNSSCFNYRNTTGGSSLSKHAKGLAVDINPLYNPYISRDTGACVPENGSDYADRTLAFSHKIDENDLCYRLFTEAGFTWGGIWESTPDYMHFEKDQ